MNGWMDEWCAALDYSGIPDAEKRLRPLDSRLELLMQRHKEM